MFLYCLLLYAYLVGRWAGIRRAEEMLEAAER